MAVNKCVKYVFFLFNLLFWISGCIILGVGIYLKVTNNKISALQDNFPSFELMIAIGAIIMVLGFLGCCGAYRENRCMLLLFFIFLLLIFILLLAAGILASVGDNKVKDWVKDELQKLTPISNQPANVVEDIEKMQRELRCCGLMKGPSDWTKIPDSCRCNVTSDNMDECKSGSAYGTSNNIYQKACYDKVIEFLKSNMKVALGIAFAIAALLIFGMAFAMVLYCQIGKSGGATV
ncbi:tetraspanin-9 [Kryptolebias marmoratus]|uniref:Tetraspanin n=1 Tax=Kryptolebias marmoratus TaxID=37003 RepID=A0A3Q3EIR4_KRYMA|nr:tetraspanin-9 [Kryptolebias marmoratus]